MMLTEEASLFRSCESALAFAFSEQYIDLPQSPVSRMACTPSRTGNGLGGNDFADCELAWTNLPKAVRRLRYLWHGMLKAPGEFRGDHPTQKPIGVMTWCLQQVPEPVQTILDPFMGSGTTGVACAQLGRKFIGIEIEPKYFDIACRRIEQAYAQGKLFEPEKQTQEQAALI
jgi:DNA modification methylase